jgi:hypothetical protein
MGFMRRSLSFCCVKTSSSGMRDPVRASDIGAMRADSYVETQARGRGSGASMTKETEMKSGFSVAAFSKRQRGHEKMFAFAWKP